MDPLTLFGLFAVTAMVVFYSLEDRSTWFTLAFAGACVLGSVYGFLQGAWPFGVVEAAWTLVAIRRWWQMKRRPPHPDPGPTGSPQRLPHLSADAQRAKEEGEREIFGETADGEKEQIILDLIRKKGQAKREDLLPVTNLSRSALGRVLDQMEVKGLIEQVGKRKGAYYKIKA